MKRIFLIISVVFFGALASSPLPHVFSVNPCIGFGEVISADAAVQYGLIGEGTVLYDDTFSPITSLPATYFVIITGEEGSYFAANYSDLSGYVDKSKVSEVDYEPKLKFGSAYFTAANDTHPVNIRTAPTAAGSLLASIPDGGSALYYGKVTGDTLFAGAGSTWYYVRYENKYGYVYGAQGTAGTFAVNSGERVTVPAGDDGDGGVGGGGFPDWGFILLLCVPAVIIMLALFARPKGGAARDN